MSTPTTADHPAISKQLLQTWSLKAQEHVAKIQGLYRTAKLTTWEGLSKITPVPVAPNSGRIEQGPLSIWLKSYPTFYVALKRAEFQKGSTPVAKPEPAPQIDPSATPNAPAKTASGRLKLCPPELCRKYGKITLFTEQQHVVDEIVRGYFDTTNPRYAFLNDGDMGSGKTYLGGAVVSEVLARSTKDPTYPWRFHKAIILTPAVVVEDYKKVLEDMGLGEKIRSREILVVNVDQMRSTMGEMFVKINNDPMTGAEEFVYSPHMLPFILVLDEFHRYNNHDTFQTKFIQSMIRAGRKTGMKILVKTGTPFEKVNDAKTFMLACRNINGVTVDDTYSFQSVAKSLDSTPDKPNRAAVARLRKVLDPYIVSFPYVKWPHKAINTIMLVDFASDHDKDIYRRAHETYLERCSKLGKNTNFGPMEQLVALGNFCKTVEPLRAPMLAELAIKNFRSGAKATLIGARFKQTIINVAFRLDEAGVPMNKWCAIHGGFKGIKTHLLMSEEELTEFLKRPLGAPVDDDTLKRVAETIRYKEDAVFNDEDPITQAARHARLQKLGLASMQSKSKRHEEKGRFQSGEAVICLMTLAAGGTGLSLHHDKPTLLPREGYFTPPFNGKEGAQALGRLPRRTSLSDSLQYIMMMRGTVEEYHVAPVFDNKLKCLGEFTNRKLSFTDLWNHDATPAQVKLRNLVEAERDAAQDTTSVTARWDDPDADADEFTNEDE